MTKNKFDALGYTILGAGFLYRAASTLGWFTEEEGLSAEEKTLAALRGGPPLRLAGAAGSTGVAGAAGAGGNVKVKGLPSGGKFGVLTKATLHRVDTIEQRVAHIQDRIRKDSLKPEVKEKASAVLTAKVGARGNLKWAVEPKNFLAEVKALYKAIQDPNSPIALRYTRDHVTVDQFMAADKLMRLNIGDCDDGTILLGSLLRSVGYPVRLRVIQDKGSETWSHIYLLVGVPPMQPSKWIPLDWSVYPYKPAGWEAPGAAQVAETGEPAGIVTKLKDFTV